MNIAFYKGNERTRSFGVSVDGDFVTTITSSGTTLELEPFELIASHANIVVLQAVGMEENGWFSITEVKVFVDDDGYNDDDDVTDTGLTLVTGVAAAANNWDTRDSSGCLPEGCLAENVLDDSIAPASRWSCSESLSPSGGACQLTLQFDAPQDIVQMNMALHRGDERVRAVDVWVDGVLVTIFESSGMTLDYEAYELIEPQASTVFLRAVDVVDNGWISITGVQFFSGNVASTSAALTPDCPDGSIPNSLDISLEFEGHLLALNLFVVEPGQDTHVGFQSISGDVGSITKVSGDFQQTGPQSITYLLLNGLSVEDAVLGDYTVYMGTSGGVWGAENIPYTLTARTSGIVQWTAEGVSPPPNEESESYVATVTEYIDNSNCNVERYGECWYTFSPTGSPPCERCPEGLSSNNRGATYCTVQSLDGAGLPEVVNDAILEDAVYGFPGSGRVTFQEDLSLIVNLGAEGKGIFSLSGNLTLGLFQPEDIPPSTGVFFYVYDVREDPVTAFVEGQGSLNTSTGEFSAAISVPDGPSRVFLVFIIQNITDATSTDFDAPQADFDVLSSECNESYLTITLETDVEGSYIDMGVFEPDSETRPVFDMGSVGYIAREEQFGLGSETYKLYNELSVGENLVLGDYRVRIFDEFIDVDTPYNLTFRVAGEIERVEEGVFPVDGSIIEISAFTIDDYASYEGC